MLQNEPKQQKCHLEKMYLLRDNGVNLGHPEANLRCLKANLRCPKANLGCPEAPWEDSLRVTLP